MKLVAVSFLLLALSVVANAQSTRVSIISRIRHGNDLYQALQECDSLKTPIENDDCFLAYGYISGVADSDAKILMPSDATWKQAFEIVRNYLTQHPERRQLASVILIRAAFKEAGWWRN